MPPKRSASSASRSQSTDPHATKKTRFVDPLDDPTNFAEQVDAELEDTTRKKGRVKNEGYESDSSDDGEGVVFSRRKDTAEDGDDDMFNMAEDDTKKVEQEGGKKKGERFLRLAEIEGQEFGAEGSGSGSESDDDEPADEDEVIRRQKAGMGYELSSFNMREEMEEGKFTDAGEFVRSFDQHQVHDKWMEGLDEKDIKLARKRKRQRDREQREKMLAEERELEQSGGKGALEMALLAYLKKGETVLEALQRVGAKSKSRKSDKRNTTTATKKPHEPSDIENITHLASNIMSLGDTDVYSRTYEELVRDVRASGRVDSAWEPPSADVKYEYMWDVEGTTAPGEIFGPFSEEEIKGWFKASYFGDGGEKIKIRAVGRDWAKWDDIFS